MKLNKLFFSSVFFISSLFSQDLDYSLHYFGNLTFNTLNKDGFAYRNFQVDDIDDDLSYEAYSKIGTQLNVSKDSFDFIAQVVAKRYEKNIEADINWLNLKYTYENYSLRAGKMQLPLFLNSNTLDIDYIHTWAKAPIEVYGIFPMKAYNGIEFLYQKAFDDVYVDLQFTPYGKIKEDVNLLDSFGEVEATLDDIKNIMLSVEFNNFTIKTSYTRGNLTIPLDGTGLSTLTSTLNYYGYSNLAKKYSFDNTKLEFLSFGIDYDYKNFLVNSEIAQMKSNSFFPDMLAYYMLVGYRYDKFTPFVMYAENKNDKSHYSEDELVTTSSDPITIATIQALRTALEQELYKMNSSQKTSSIGLKYDFKKGIDFKLQIDRITTTDYGTPNTDGEYERLGFLARERGVSDSPTYLYTLSVGFAF